MGKKRRRTFRWSPGCNCCPPPTDDYVPCVLTPLLDPEENCIPPWPVDYLGQQYEISEAKEYAGCYKCQMFAPYDYSDREDPSLWPSAELVAAVYTPLSADGFWAGPDMPFVIARDIHRDPWLVHGSWTFTRDKFLEGHCLDKCLGGEVRVTHSGEAVGDYPGFQLATNCGAGGCTGNAIITLDGFTPNMSEHPDCADFCNRINGYQVTAFPVFRAGSRNPNPAYNTDPPYEGIQDASNCFVHNTICRSPYVAGTPPNVRLHMPRGGLVANVDGVTGAECGDFNRAWQLDEVEQLFEACYPSGLGTPQFQHDWFGAVLLQTPPSGYPPPSDTAATWITFRARWTAQGNSPVVIPDPLDVFERVEMTLEEWRKEPSDGWPTWNNPPGDPWWYLVSRDFVFWRRTVSGFDLKDKAYCDDVSLWDFRGVAFDEGPSDNEILGCNFDNATINFQLD